MKFIAIFEIHSHGFHNIQQPGFKVVIRILIISTPIRITNIII